MLSVLSVPLWWILPPLLLASACGRSTPTADLVLRGGTVHTMDDDGTRAQALGIDAGTIVYVGSSSGVEELIGPDTRVLDLEGAMVLPGFHDSHVHPATGGIELGQCDLNAIPTREAVFAKVQACAASASEGDWIVGGGWDLPLFPDASPGRADLDRLVGERPAYLSSADGHSAWVSSRALEIAGIDASTPNPPNGRIERDRRTGAPSGTLRESAMALVSKHVPPLTEEDYREGLRRGLAMANRFGITSLVEANATDRVVEAYRALAAAGELTARVRLSLAVHEDQDESQVDALVKKQAEIEGPWLRADAAKIFADGVIEARTAALLSPYLNGDLDHRGELNFAPELLERIVARLDREGFQIHVHAIGDRAIRASLDAIEKAREANGKRDARHHLAHIELFHPDDIPRFRELGVIANFQPLWAYADTYITELTVPVLGPERSRWLYPIASVAASGAVLAAGSDWSVSSMNPLAGIQVAITRRALEDGTEEAFLPEERVDLETILSAYTRGGAFVQHQEHLTGTLEVGKRADVVVLDRDLFEIPPEEIHEAEVLLTLLDGKEVYRSLGAAGARGSRGVGQPASVRLELGSSRP